MKEGEIKEILGRFPDLNIDNFVELGTKFCGKPGLPCYNIELQDPQIFSHVRHMIGKSHNETINMIPTMLRIMDAPAFFFLNVEQFRTQESEGLLPIRGVDEELGIILENHNHPGIFCLTKFQSWPDYPKWMPTISKDLILKIFQKHNRKVVDHFEKNNHYIIVAGPPESSLKSSPKPLKVLKAPPRSTYRSLQYVIYATIVIGIFIGVLQITT
ncbi:MAG: hypothetical protein ACW98K_12365 [Candidatus Kariarchaeaceae archaeon]|jgi:hypothetical protein